MGATLTRSDAIVQVRIPGVAGILLFETRSGGTLSRTTNKRARAGSGYRTGGRSGPATIEDIVVTRQHDPDVDSALAAYLETRQGKLEGCEVIEPELDVNRKPRTDIRPKRWPSCRLELVNTFEPDSDSDELGMLSLTLSCQEPMRR
ncbi:hypothetical protein [Euzebya rosea]|uniref:hypothetical protein n=1 Tax=Euzebya rosea TaxID=2052804 RepID=UPI000D3E82EA|nr:hypothetical protein [Euzebya rosea]